MIAERERNVVPVRGHGWYKRPYKLRSRGRIRAFHWKGARDKEAERERLWGIDDVEVWDEPIDATVRRD